MLDSIFAKEDFVKSSTASKSTLQQRPTLRKQIFTSFAFDEDDYVEKGSPEKGNRNFVKLNTQMGPYRKINETYAGSSL